MAQGQYATGAIYDKAASEAVPIKATLLTRDYSVLPRSHSLLLFCPRVGDQGQNGTCTAWATTWAAFSIAEAVRYNQKDSAIITAEAFAPLYVYQSIRKKENAYSCQRGTAVEHALEFLKKTGTPKFKNYNILCGVGLPDAFPENMLYRIDDYFRLFDGSVSDEIKISRVKKALSQDFPVVFAMNVPMSFFSTGESWMGRRVGEEKGVGHAMCLVGYDDDKNGGSFLIMNSWGKYWGKNGFTWIPYSVFAQNAWYAYEIFVKKLVLPEPQPKPEPKPVIVKNKMRGEVELKLSTGETIRVTRTDGVYRVKGGFISGTRYRAYITNDEPAYVYIIGSDLGDNVSIVFPPDEKTSPALIYKSNHIAIPDETYYIEMDNTKGTDYMCILYCSREINIKQVVSDIKKAEGSFKEKVSTAVSKQADIVSDANYNTHKILFSAESENEVVPVIIEIPHK
jgi:hypothetical protein